MIQTFTALQKGEGVDEDSVGTEIIVNNNMLSIKLEIVQTGETSDIEAFNAENIISGRYEEGENKRHRSVQESKELSDTTKFIIAHPEHYKTKTKWIQAIACEGLERAEIANLLGISYQQVRQALIQINK